MQGWGKLLRRNSERLLLFINQHSCLHPVECHRNTANEGKHGKLSIIKTKSSGIVQMSKSTG